LKQHSFNCHCGHRKFGKQRTKFRLKFGETVIKRGAPMATMEDVLVPVYLHHRYQLEAATKLVAGVSYAYTMRGDGLPGPVAVPAAKQLAALDAVLDVVAPANLALPRSLLAALPPRPFLIEPTRELFDRWTGLTFDPLSPGATIANVTFDLLLDETRASRLVAQKAIDPSLPGLADVLKRVESKIFVAAGTSSYDAALAALVQRAYVDHVLTLAESAGMPIVRAEARYTLMTLLTTTLRSSAAGRASATHEQREWRTSLPSITHPLLQCVPMMPTCSLEGGAHCVAARSSVEPRTVMLST
jgi:hypothetical protein